MKDNLTQNADEMSMTDERVAGLLGGLKRVEAPAGFDIRVRSAIANAKSATKPGFGFRQVLLYAAPVAILAAIGIPLAFYFVGKPVERTPANTPAITRTETTKTAPLPDVTVTASPETPYGQVAAVSSPVPPGSTREPASETSNTARKGTSRASGGSYVEASREGKRILPKGLDPTARTPERPEDFSMNARISAKDVLSTLGINARLEASVWKIESVTENSTADRAGLKPGDIVRAINDQVITGSTEFKGNVSGKSIRIIRDGKDISVELPRR